MTSAPRRRLRRALGAGEIEGLHAVVAVCGPPYAIVPLAAGAPPPSRPCWMARHTRSGLHGICTSETPNWRTASTTALTTAGVDAMVPASPTPLTPNGFDVAGDSVRSVTNEGRSAAEGTR